MEHWKVCVALILSFCWLLRIFKIKWAGDLRDNGWLSEMCFTELFGWLFFLWKVADCHHFHRSGSGAVGAWAHIRETLACLWWQGQWLYNLIYRTLYSYVFLAQFWIWEQLSMLLSLGMQWEQRAALCEPQSSCSHHHRLCCKYSHITASLLTFSHTNQCMNRQQHQQKQCNVLYTGLRVRRLVCHRSSVPAVPPAKCFLMW